MASWLVRSRVRALAGDIVLCFWTSHFTLKKIMCLSPLRDKIWSLENCKVIKMLIGKGGGWGGGGTVCHL